MKPLPLISVFVILELAGLPCGPLYAQAQPKKPEVQDKIQKSDTVGIRAVY
jgi:hypothetical protein